MTVSVKHKVNFYDTDAMAVVHHSNYIRWFEEVRTEYLESRGFPYAKMEELGVMIPVLSVDCRYKRPVRFGQTVLINTVIEEFDGLRMKVGYKITDEETGKLMAEGHSEHCFVEAESFRPIRLDKAHPEMAAIFSGEDDNKEKSED